MAQIMTVRGPIRPEELGFTTMHEHILMDGKCFRRSVLAEEPGITESVPPDAKVTLENCGLIRHNFFLTWDAQDLDDEEAMAGEVQDFRESGGNAILELSVPGIRADVAGIRRISERTGVHVVVATGFYVESSWQPALLPMDTEDYYRQMMDEVKHGIDGTGILPGCIKIGLSPFTAHEEMALRAAARVAGETGLPLTVHPSTGTGGDPRRIVQVLREEGMDLSRAVIAHISGTVAERDLRTLVRSPESWKLKLDLAHALLDTGVNISFEFQNQSEFEYGGDLNPQPFQKLAGLVRLIDEGYCKQIVLGTDVCAKPMARRYGGHGYCRLTNFVIPGLRRFGGVNDYAIRQMTVCNPARILACGR